MSTWFKVSDAMPEHPDVIGLTDSAFRSFVQAMAYCSRNRTDGWVPRPAGRSVMQRPKDAQELVAANRLREEPDGWWVVNYLEHNRSKAQIEAEREKARSRKAKQRSHGEPPDNVSPLSRRDIEGTAS